MKQQRIVCAAIKRRGSSLMILGIRHWDRFMHDAAMAYKNIPMDDWTEQGFVDNQNQFLNRLEAWKVAEAAGQIISRVGGDTTNGGTLYSENLY